MLSMASQAGAGGVAIEGDLLQAARLNLELRTATRVLARLGGWPRPIRCSEGADDLTLVPVGRRDDGQLGIVDAALGADEDGQLLRDQRLVEHGEDPLLLVEGAEEGADLRSRRENAYVSAAGSVRAIRQAKAR